MKGKLNFFIKSHRKLGILIDTVNGFFVVLILITLIAFFSSSIIHNLLRVIEASNEYSGKYKKLYYAGDGMMNLYSKGTGDKTIIIFPEIGDSSPVIKYKALADSLSIGYKVIIAEPLGYGYSLSTKKDRTSKNIVNELKDALKNAGIGGPYILLTFWNSSIYADYYSKHFPEEVLGEINIDALYPTSLNNEDFKNKYLSNIIYNANFYSVLSFSGLFRWKSYIIPKKYSIDKMQLNNSYGKKEIKLYRNRLANKFLTKEMRKECSKLQNNMSELRNFKFSDNFSSLQIITNDYKDEYSKRKENIIDYANDLITNKDIQNIKTIDGELNYYLYNKEGIINLKNLIFLYF